MAAANAKTAMHVTLNGVDMGQTVESNAPVRIQANLACAREIPSAGLVRDGEVLPVTEINGTTASVELVDEDVSEGDHWYSVRVLGTASDGEIPRAPLLAYSSPFFVAVS